MDPFKLVQLKASRRSHADHDKTPKKGQLEANPNTKKTTSKGKNSIWYAGIFRVWYCNLISSIQNSLLTDYTLPWIPQKIAPPQKNFGTCLASLVEGHVGNGMVEWSPVLTHPSPRSHPQKKPRPVGHGPCRLSQLDLPRSRHHNKKEKWCCPRRLGVWSLTNLQWIFFRFNGNRW